MNLASSLLLMASLAGGGATAAPPSADIEFLQVEQDITLRRLVVRPDAPKGTVLLLHGFPETVYAWKDIALALGRDYEVHAFDWPGYGQSSRPAAETFGYAPKDYARVLKAYLDTTHIDSANLTIYATDIGALPVLLAALDDPRIARRIVVGDFAPFDRPQYMYPSLQNLKGSPAAEPTRAAMNKGRDEILANTWRRDLPPALQFDVSAEFAADMAKGWDYGTMTTVDAFAQYYAHFSRDQQYLEENLSRLRTPVRVVWGERDGYINPGMGAEFAAAAGVEIEVLPNIGHYPHLQDPQRTIEEIRASFR